MSFNKPFFAIFSVKNDISKRNLSITTVLVLLMLLFTSACSGGEDKNSAEDQVVNEVSLVAAGALASDVTLTTIGTVSSFHDVDMRAESAGRIVSLPVAKGQRVATGQVIMELDHAIANAQVSSAQAAVASSQALLDKMQRGDRPENIAILEQQISAAQEQLKQLKRGARAEEIAITEAKLANAKKTLEDSQRNLGNSQEKTEKDLESNKQSAADALKLAAVTAEKILSQNLQTIIYPILFPPNKTCILQIISSQTEGIEKSCFETVRAVADIRTIADKTSATNSSEIIIENLNATTEKLIQTRQFLADLFITVSATISTVDSNNQISASELDTLKTLVNSAQTEIETTLTKVTTQRQNLQTQIILNKTAVDTAQSAVTQSENTINDLEKQLALQLAGSTPEQIAIQESQVAQLELQLKIATSGAREEDIRSQKAAVQQAQAGLATAQTNRNKAIITAPFVGTIIQLPYEVGDYINNSEIVSSIANQDQLEARTYITESEKNLIAVGDTVNIQKTKASGTVTLISPALDSQTKKIEVEITITSGSPDLVIGQTVFIDFKAEIASSVIRIPIISVRVSGNTAQVFTVKDGVVVALPVTVGQVYGDTIEVTGIENDTLIIPDISGIEEGDQVSIATEKAS